MSVTQTEIGGEAWLSDVSSKVETSNEEEGLPWCCFAYFLMFITEFQVPTLSIASVTPISEVHMGIMLVLLMMRNC
jgi:hypothetical protein